MSEIVYAAGEGPTTPRMKPTGEEISFKKNF